MSLSRNLEWLSFLLSKAQGLLNVSETVTDKPRFALRPHVMPMRIKLFPSTAVILFKKTLKHGSEQTKIPIAYRAVSKTLYLWKFFVYDLHDLPQIQLKALSWLTPLQLLPQPSLPFATNICTSTVFFQNHII
ncbi:hypothetical protein GQX74_004577 [Glossina fuscipes]|nr:hypothetical protein GQX74_004577 [Glossina fuscipes]